MDSTEYEMFAADQLAWDFYPMFWQRGRRNRLSKRLQGALRANRRLVEAGHELAEATRTKPLAFDTYRYTDAKPELAVVWELQEGSERDGGLEVLSIPCVSKDVALEFADQRAGRLLDIGRREGVNQVWEDYGGVPSGRHFVRQACEGTWQHVRMTFVVVDPKDH